MDIDLLKVVKGYEQRGIDALFDGQADGKQWILGSNYLRIDYKDNAGKTMDTHPHVNTVIKRLAASNLNIKQQQAILQGCEHHAASEYLECIQQSDQIKKSIKDDIISDDYFGF